MTDTGVAMLIIDMQNGFCAPDGSFAKLGKPVENYQAMIPELARMRDAARASGVPVIYVSEMFRPGYPEAGYLFEHRRHPPLREVGGLLQNTWDVELVPELTPAPEEIVVEKRRYDGFVATDLDLVLRRLGVSRLLATGIATHACVESTVRSAVMRDYEVVVASDAVASRDERLHRMGLEVMAAAFADVMPWREIPELAAAGADSPTGTPAPADRQTG
ncbi:cysteine hydrolase [Streptosporangium sp. NPDC051022]|uniref:cysteine hydrolase family protein n=1 Tax=Streptosporangium sp. NPDC051022 TaxID=3155752 RepID=UPI003441F258